MSDQSRGIDDPPMHRRRATMFDGRYMYYYTFGDDAGDGETENPEEKDV